MIKCDPKQLILEQLRSSETFPSDLRAFLNEHPHFWRPVKYKRSLPHGARTATLRFLKERAVPGYQAYAITFEDVAELSWNLFCLMVQDAEGDWHVEGCSGTVGNMLPGRQHTRPRVNLSGEWDGYFYAGGSVIDDARLGVARVRLIASNGLILEDTVEEYVVLFVTDQQVQLPLQVEFYNHSGELVGTQLALEEPTEMER